MKVRQTKDINSLIHVVRVHVIIFSLKARVGILPNFNWHFEERKCLPLLYSFNQRGIKQT